MKRTLFVAMSLSALLSGCALISDPMPMGNDVYTLHATGGTYSSQAGLKSDLWKEATEFCAKRECREFRVQDDYYRWAI